MTNLAKYTGNFLTFADNEFAFNSIRTERFSDITLLDIFVGCLVGIFPSATQEVVVEIDTDDLSNFEIFQKDDTVVINQKQAEGAVIISNNNKSSMNISNMTISGIYIDGKPYNPEQSKLAYPHKIRIYAPLEIDIDARLIGTSILASKVIFDLANIDASGVSAVGIAAKSLDLDLSGSGENYCVIKGGKLNIDVSGMGKVVAKGEFSEVDADVFGMGSISTTGICKGKYSASVSGMGSISHTGEIKGRLRKSVSGMGSIHI